MKALSKKIEDCYPSVLKFAENLEGAYSPAQAAAAIPSRSVGAIQ